MSSHRPRKRFGQHFLHDRNVIGRIVAALAPRPEDHVVEIGPGQGALTRELATRLAHFDAVELDRDLLAHLPSVIPPDKLTLHGADALKFDFCRLMQEGRKLRLGLSRPRPRSIPRSCASSLTPRPPWPSGTKPDSPKWYVPPSPAAARPCAIT